VNKRPKTAKKELAGRCLLLTHVVFVVYAAIASG
jgi:hypothetical protein